MAGSDQRKRVFYLGKDGQVFGPFAEDEILRMKQAGEYLRYSWLWDSTSPSWVPINPPPVPLPPGAEKARQEPVVEAAPPSERTQPEVRQQPEARSTPPPLEVSAIRHAICHNNQDIVTGELRGDLEQEMVLSSSEFSSSLPPFGKGSRAWLNVLDEKNGQSSTFAVTVIRFHRADQNWEFHLKRS